MNKHHFFSSLILSVTGLVLLVFSLSGCDNVSGSNTSNSTITGRVVQFSQSSASPVEGATVTMSQIQINGSLVKISNGSVQTDANGSFTIKTSLGGYHYLVTTAQKDNQIYMALVDEPTSFDKAVYSALTTPESTVETNIFLQTISQLSYAYISLNNHIRTIINSNIASEISADNTSQATLASAFLQREDTRLQMLISTTYIGATQTQVDNIESLQNQSAVSLNSSLYNYYNIPDSVAAVYDRFYNSLSSAFIQSSLTYIDFLEVSNAADQVMANASVSLVNTLQFQLKQQSDIFMTYAIGKEVINQLTQVNASGTLIANANTELVNLRNSFRNAASVTDLEQAYTTYRANLIGILKTMYAADANSILAIDNTINSSGGLKSQLESSVNQADETTVIRSFVTYFNSIQSTVKTNLTSASNTEITVITNIMESINLLL